MNINNIGPGDIVKLDKHVSTQFTANVIYFRVISAPKASSQEENLMWLSGYELDMDWNAVERREVLVDITKVISHNR